MDIPRCVTVIGGGITGLGCAYYLKRAGIPVTVFEASDRPGGIVATVERNEFLFEAGPQFPRFPRRLLKLVQELGLDGEFVRCDPKAPRYVVKQGRLHRLPLSIRAFLATSLVGARVKARLVTEAFRRSRPPEHEETLAALIRRKFGDEALDYLVDPVVSAVFAGEPEEMGVESAFPFLSSWEREHGSLFRGALKAWRGGNGSKSLHGNGGSVRPNDVTDAAVTDSLPPLGTFRQGMGVLPRKLAEALGGSLVLCKKAEQIEALEGTTPTESGWKIHFSDGQDFSCRAVIMAAPADEAAGMFRRAAPVLSSLLSEIEYAPMVVIGLGYARNQVRHPLAGFGFMVPRREGTNVFYNVWNSSMCPGRAPQDKVLLTSFAGGATNRQFVEQNEGEIVQRVDMELGKILGIEGGPVERLVRKFPKALPLMNVGHAKRVQEIRESVGRLPGISLIGNYLEGRSLGDCADLAFQTAMNVRRQFQA